MYKERGRGIGTGTRRGEGKERERGGVEGREVGGEGEDGGRE